VRGVPAPPLLRALAAVIRERREALQLSQERLGDLHRNYVGGVERGEINPTLTQLQRLAAGLGVPVWELLREAEARASSFES
jgi:transcriptional regulator with XRE-family HTH domain